MADTERQGLTEEEQAELEEANEMFPGWDNEKQAPEGDESESAEGEGGTGQQAQPQPFKFSDEETAEAGGQDPGPGQQPGIKDDDYIEIVHRGEKKFVHKDKAKDLIQKGYDYDVKVGPHSRFAQLIERDPQAAHWLDQYFRAKIQGQQPPPPPGSQQQPQGNQQQSDDPFKGMDDDEPITAAEARKALQALQAQQIQQIPQTIQQQMQQAQQQQAMSQRQGGMNQVAMMLQSRDPQNFAKVAPRLQEAAAQTLTKAQYDRVNNDPAALCEFYDYVKDQVVGGGQPQARQGGGRQASGGGTFRAQSGGGQPPRGKDAAQKIWEMPRKDFEAEMAKIKGY